MGVFGGFSFGAYWHFLEDADQPFVYITLSLGLSADTTDDDPYATITISLSLEGEGGVQRMVGISEAVRSPRNPPVETVES